MTPEEKERKARVAWRRKHMTIRKTTLEESKNEPDPLLPGTFGELMEIACEYNAFACEFGGKYDAKQPFQRNITRIIRPKR